MYVCLCKGITDSQIRTAILNGDASSLRDVRSQLGVSSQCGQCTQLTKQIVDDALTQAAAHPHPDLFYSIS